MQYIKNGSIAALVSNIQKYTIHDGPGIRTEIFFTGCTLRCLWCSNPETILPKRRFGVYPTKCVTRDKCAWCVKACPETRNGSNALLEFDGNGTISRINAENLCEDCYRCADACPSRAIKVWGELYTVAELMKIIEEDRSFYERTGGGVTLSGGEALLQPEFAETLLRECKLAGINTCVETALNVPWASAERVFAQADLVIADLKLMDSARHREYTGAGNELILANLRKTVERGKKLVLRTPIVPGYNDSDGDMRAAARFVRDELGGKIVAWQLLPYRKMGTEKYDSLGETYPMGDYAPPERADWEENLRHIEQMIRDEYGLPVTAGSSARLEL